ncbi:MAG: penicillin-binding protein [Frankia sp.]|nr:penicillin-binding protein [Frankia sp.]
MLAVRLVAVSGGGGTVPLMAGGYTASPRRRGRRRPRRAVALGATLLLLLGAGAGGGYLWKTSRDRAAADRAALGAAQAYLAAWQGLVRGQDGAGAQLAARTTTGDVDPAALVAAMTDMRDRLRLTGAELTTGELRRDGATATVPYTAAMRLADQATPFAYSGELVLVRVGQPADADAAWRVLAQLSSVHPRLAQGLAFDRTAPPGRRGDLLDVNGQPLRENRELALNLVGQVDPPSGLERAFGDRLAPRGGEIVLRDGAGAVVATLARFPAADGEQIRTTIDMAVQHAAEQAMATSTFPNGALVAIDTRTGGVLAAANNPPGGYSRALRGTYPPGSTFKIITATAALMNGVRPDTQIDCPRTVTAGGRVFANAEGEEFGRISFAEAFAHSCNTAFVNVASGLPDGALTEAARMFGFDGSEPLPIASVGGVFPEPTDAAETASAAIGQGRVSTSPLQMASVAAAVASGTWRTPFVAGGPARTTELPEPVVRDLRAFMRSVVTDGTVAEVSFPGEVHGKTGTAEYSDGNPPPTHAWFVGYRGDVAFAVVIDDGGFGATAAAPVAAAFLRALDGTLETADTPSGTDDAGAVASGEAGAGQDPAVAAPN